MMLTTTKYCTLIAVVLCTKFRDGFTLSNTRPEVNTTITCTSKWQMLNLKWNSTVENTSITHNFSSFWKRNGEDVKRQTIKRLLQTVIYPHNFTQNVSCYGKLWIYNVSFDVALPKVESELLGVRFLARPAGLRALEFYIRAGANISYSLSYCCEDCKILADNYKCPKYKELTFSCSWRDHDVFRIANSAGFICKASTRSVDEIYINSYKNHKFYIRTRTQDGFSSVSADFRISTKGSGDGDGAISGHADQGHFTVILMGRKSGYLIVEPTKDLVKYYC